MKKEDIVPIDPKPVGKAPGTMYVKVGFGVVSYPKSEMGKVENKWTFRKDLEYRNKIKEGKIMIVDPETIDQIQKLEQELEGERDERELIELENANLEGQIIVYKEIIKKLMGENK